MRILLSCAMMVHTGGTDTISCNRGSNGCITKQAIITGKSSHAGGAPHLGVNALYAANCAMTAANAVRETFIDEETIRFHPIITAGGSAVNAIPDKVIMESYVRGATLEAISRENGKINRAFSGAAAALGCGLYLKDQHGYAPRDNNVLMADIFSKVAKMLLPEDKVRFNDSWTTGCSDMGDICSVMPAIHPYVGGCAGHSHGDDFRIIDPYLACVISAKLQVGVVYALLRSGAQEANTVLANSRQDYPSIPDYLASISALSFEGNAVTYQEDGTVLLKFKK